MITRRLLCLLAVCAASSLQAAPTIELVDAQAVTFNLPAGEYTDSYFVRVPSGTSNLRIEVDTAGSQDVDLFLRSGSTFPTQITDYDFLYEATQYLSAGVDGDEHLSIDTSSSFPLAPGDWYLSMVNLGSTPASISLRADLDVATVASIEMVFDDPDGPECNVAAWNDPAPATPVGGNTGTTLGAQRRNAAREAARLLAAELQSPLPIRIRACWADLENDGPLAQAGPSSFYRDFPGARQRHTFYGQPAVVRQAGTRADRLSANGDTADVIATFNLAMDRAGQPVNAHWHYGFGEPAQGEGFNFIAVAMHEIVHGLGFSGLLDVETNEIGGAPYYDAFLRNLNFVDGTNATPFVDLVPAERQVAITSGFKLHWNRAAPAEPGGEPRTIRMYAPNPAQPGSSVFHTNPASHRTDLMTPAVAPGSGSQTLGLARTVLEDVGWDPNPGVLGTAPAPLPSLWYDRNRSGHGFDLLPASGDTWALFFYTYDASGAPEYYLAVGQILDGRFVVPRNQDGFGLVRYNYVEGNNPPQTADPVLGGNLVIDFEQGATHPACNDGTDRGNALSLAAFEYSIGSESGAWCIEPQFAPESRPAASDFTGSWFSGGDPGWGLSLVSGERTDGTDYLFALLYYPSPDGSPRWAFAFAEPFVSGQPLDLVQRNGYCRDCAFEQTDTVVGSLRLDLVNDGLTPDPANRADIDVEFQGPGGGAFVRSNVPIQYLLRAPPAE